MRRSDAGRGALEDLAIARCAETGAAASPVQELELILERVQRLRYDHNNPERFFAERSDITGAIGGLLKRMRPAPPAALAIAAVGVGGTRMVALPRGQSAPAGARAAGRPTLSLPRTDR